jgi:hypothetical protein
MRSRVQTITPKKATEYLEQNTANRPLSTRTVREFAAAMRRGEWQVTHQGIAFDTNGTLVDGQHRLAAIIEADMPVELTVFTEVAEGAFDVLDTGKRRNAADVLAIEGEKSAVMLAAMVRTVWLYQNRPELNWSGGDAGVSNHQIVATLEQHPKLRDFIGTGEQIATATGMIKSAAGAASYLVTQASRRDLSPGSTESSKVPVWPRATRGCCSAGSCSRTPANRPDSPCAAGKPANTSPSTSKHSTPGPPTPR